jgi:hypothetical protein
MAKRKRYTDKFRADCVTFLSLSGYPDKIGTLEKASLHLGVPTKTLTRWYRSENNPPPDNVVAHQKKEMSVLFEDLVYKFGEHASKDEVIADMTGQQAVTAMGIAVDKMRLLRGLPTEIIDVAPQLTRLVELMNQFNHSLPDVINRMIMRYEKQLGDGSDTITAVQ